MAGGVLAGGVSSLFKTEVETDILPAQVQGIVDSYNDGPQRIKQAEQILGQYDQALAQGNFSPAVREQVKQKKAQVEQAIRFHQNLQGQFDQPQISYEDARKFLEDQTSTKDTTRHWFVGAAATAGIYWGLGEFDTFTGGDDPAPKA